MMADCGFPCDTCKYFDPAEGCLMDFGTCPAIWDRPDAQETADMAVEISHEVLGYD